MVRNLDHRFELVCPIEDPKLQKELLDMLQIQLADNTKARLLNMLDVDEMNNYRPRKPHEPEVRSQFAIYNYFKRKSDKA